MRRRLIASTALIALAAVLVLGVPLGIVEARRSRAEQIGRLEREADAVAAAVDDRLEAGKPIRVASLRGLVRPGHRVTINERRPLRIGSPLRGPTIDVRSGLTPEARVTASAPASELSERVRNTWVLISLLAVAGTGAAVALAGLQARRLARPLERLADASTLLGTGDFSTRAGRFGIPEIDAVAAALDTTAVRIARLLGREREFSADVSHQLRTPLTALRLRLEELAKLDQPDLVAAEAAAALAEADRLERTITALLSAARQGGARAPMSLELNDLARRHVERWRATYAREERTLRLEPSAPLEVAGTAGAVGQALDVLLENALRHGEGTVTVSVLQRRGHGCLRVEDAGAGVPAGDEREIFERGSSLSGGTGIGLHLARALVEADRGRLVLARERPAAFEVRLTLVPPAEAPDHREQSAASP